MGLGFAVAFAVYVAGGVSGAHLNPAVTLAQAVSRGFPWKKVGFIVVAIGISYGANAGYAINPARDLGPRILAFFEGWKSVAIPGDYGKVNSYMWVPIVGPLVGGVLGGSTDIDENGRTAPQPQ